MISTKFLNYAYVNKVEVNAGGYVKARISTSRKGTDFDKFKNEKGYVTSSWFADFSKEASADAKGLKIGDKIIIPPDGFSITCGEKYAEDKYSPARLTIWKWSYNDGGQKKSGSESSKPAVAEEDEEDLIPF